MLRIMFSDPGNLTTPGLNHSLCKLGTLPLMNRYVSRPVGYRRSWV